MTRGQKIIDEQSYPQNLWITDILIPKDEFSPPSMDMPSRKNVSGCIDIAVMQRATLVTGLTAPFTFQVLLSQHLYPFS